MVGVESLRIDRPPSTTKKSLTDWWMNCTIWIGVTLVPIDVLIDDELLSKFEKFFSLLLDDSVTSATPQVSVLTCFSILTLSDI